jgi:hypothetical protein
LGRKLGKDFFGQPPVGFDPGDLMSIEPPWALLSVSRDQAAQFLVVFARCEFALKAVKRFRRTTPKLAADWDTFATTVAPKFSFADDAKLEKAVKYLLERPPKKEVEVSGNLDWTDADPGGTDVQRLAVYVRRVRNNLFHGAKWVASESDEQGRDQILVDAALIVLSALIRLDGEVLYAFNDWPPREGW